MDLEKTHYNPAVEPLIKLIDADNGKGYSKNIETRGLIIKLENSDAQMLYEVKKIKEIRAVFIRYIHYNTEDELYSLLAFAVKWWRNLNPHIVYYKEKDRDNKVGEYLTSKLNFQESQVKNTLKEFDCLRDGGHPCTCKVYEYVAAKPKKNRKLKKKQQDLDIIV